MDIRYMRRALDLARKGVALASPNPCVGAVVVGKDGNIVGEGTHTYEGRKHAEIVALEQAGLAAKGSTLYLNLEPCSHHGRTGPCADAVIGAGVARVVAAMADPNPLVSGRGFERLRVAGLDVSVGVAEAEARELNESFAKFIRTRRPMVTLKAAMTLDGRIAPSSASAENSAPVWVTGESAREHVHQLRHQSDAILVGIGTVIADDPLLTDRSGLSRRRPLLRVVVDSRLRTPLDSQLVRTAHEDVVIFCTAADSDKKSALESRGVRIEQAGAGNVGEFPDLSKVVAWLGEADITSLLIEGGAQVNWVALSSGIVDKVFLYYAPKILGGREAVPFVGGMGFSSLSEAPTIHNLTIHRFREDFAVEGYMKDPYSD